MGKYYEQVEVIKQGIQMNEEHACSWVKGNLAPNTPENVFDNMRICRECGRVERVIKTKVDETFESIFEKFYGQKKVSE